MTSTQPDLDEAAIRLADYWPYHAVVLADLVSRRTSAIVKAQSGLNLSQWRVIVAVGERPGRSAADVVAITPMDKGIVSRAVAGLIKQGYIRREYAAKDRRRSALYLTQHGRDSYARISKALLDSFGSLPGAERLQAELKDAASWIKNRQTRENPGKQL